eukprot:COSAG06_NODE_6508_length_2901_cov_92.073876_4_plen_58_part_00
MRLCRLHVVLVARECQQRHGEDSEAAILFETLGCGLVYQEFCFTITCATWIRTFLRR